jgi:hypothetical protein
MIRRLSPLQLALTIAVGLLLLTNVYLGVTFLDTLGQRDRLAGQLVALERAFTNLTESPSAGEGVIAPFPKSPPGIDLAEAIVRSARETGNEVLGFQASAVGADQIGSGTYRVVKLTLRLRSGPAQLARFFEQVEASGTATLVFDNIDVTETGGQWEVAVDLLTYAQGV